MVLKLLLVLVVIGLSIYGFVSFQEDLENDEVKKYEGPVPEGFDVEHFRKTGETIREGLKNG